MTEHVITILDHTKAIPSRALPDGAITGNGDVTAMLSGSSDRVKIYISKVDFWKADGRAYVDCCGGLAPLGLVEILLPHLAYADYKVEQDMDKAFIKLSLVYKNFSAELKITVCAEENTIILELDKTYPTLSASAELVPIEGNEAINYAGREDNIKYTVRGFDTENCRFPTYGICAMKEISKTVSNGREKTVWAINVCTNHDTAAYKKQTMEKLSVINEKDCEKLLRRHGEWWTKFWSKSGVSLSDKKLELYWYAGLYSIACCARNKKFPPGIWGGYSTADGMEWFSDYHMNYNYEAPFYAMASSNHTELLECYASPLNDFLPRAKRYAEKYLGVKGAYYPVGIGPMGMETLVRPDTKEHGHLFLGQKSNAAYACVIPMMHWYATLDKDFAKREYYDFLMETVEFWENYLVFEDGKYQIYNDCLNEVEWYIGPEHMPQRHDEKNPAVSCALVKMLMKLAIDVSGALGENPDKIPVWQHIYDNVQEISTFEHNGENVIQGAEGAKELLEVAMESMYPIGQIGKYSTPELFDAAKNMHRQMSIWRSSNRFCSYYPMAARLELPAEEIISQIYKNIEYSGLPNGMFSFGGGGLENSSAVPSTVNEMLLQSYEGIIRLFPAWDRKQDASFHGLRANGAFVIDAKLENGNIYAEIFSEKGMPLTIENPHEEYVLIKENGERITVTDRFYTLETQQNEKIILSTLLTF